MTAANPAATVLRREGKGREQELENGRLLAPCIEGLLFNSGGSGGLSAGLARGGGDISANKQSGL